MKLGEQSSTILAHHNSMAILLNAALGGDKDTPNKPVSVRDPDVVDLAAGHGSLEAAVAAINSAMTI